MISNNSGFAEESGPSGIWKKRHEREEIHRDVFPTRGYTKYFKYVNDGFDTLVFRHRINES